MSEIVAGVARNSFYQFSKGIATHLRDLTRGGCKVLLTNNAYRLHLSTETIMRLQEHNIGVYALPEKLSGRT